MCLSKLIPYSWLDQKQNAKILYYLAAIFHTTEDNIILIYKTAWQVLVKHMLVTEDFALRLNRQQFDDHLCFCYV